MKRNSFKIFPFISATIIFGIFTFITLIAAASVDEGTDGNSALIQVLAKLFYIFRFPTHTLFFSFMGGSFFFIGLGINCILRFYNGKGSFCV
jgi:di/tricarboxylate transporter